MTWKWEKMSMKLALFFILFSFSIWARPLVLVGYFDAFGQAPFNNSERVAKLLMEKMKGHPEVDLRLCSLQTVFDKSFYQLEDCLRDMPETPHLVLGLGESNCNFKVEIMGRNKDHTYGPDNEGNERVNSPVIPGGPAEIGLKYPLAKMYCSLPVQERKEIEVSNNAGSFVCNNLAYQFAYTYENLVFGFIHVPANHCRNLERKTATSVKNLESMILEAIKVKTVERLPVKKKELEVFRQQHRNDQCLSEFYKRAKGADEKGFWTLGEIR